MLQPKKDLNEKLFFPKFFRTQNKCDKLSDTDVAVHIGRPSLGYPGPELCVAKTCGEREGTLGEFWH